MIQLQTPEKASAPWLPRWMGRESWPGSLASSTRISCSSSPRPWPPGRGRPRLLLRGNASSRRRGAKLAGRPGHAGASPSTGTAGPRWGWARKAGTTTSRGISPSQGLDVIERVLARPFLHQVVVWSGRSRPSSKAPPLPGVWMPPSRRPPRPTRPASTARLAGSLCRGRRLICNGTWRAPAGSAGGPPDRDPRQLLRVGGDSLRGIQVVILAAVWGSSSPRPSSSIRPWPSSPWRWPGGPPAAKDADVSSRRRPAYRLSPGPRSGSATTSWRS